MYDPYQIQKNAMLAQLDAPTKGDQAYQEVSSYAPQVLQKFGGSLGWTSSLPKGTLPGITIGTELLGGLLKPKHDTATVNSPFGSYVDQYKRRMEGSGEGVAGGAVKGAGRGASVGSFIPGVGTAIGAGVGALAGAIGGLFNKSAKSAYTDFSADDARQAIRDIYKNEGGRAVDDATVTQILQGQGWKPGDHWVGEKGLFDVLGSLRNNFALERQMQGGGGA